MDEVLITVGLAILFLFGYVLGQQMEARHWRGKGDHSYMNRMESGGKLYRVYSDQEPGS